MYENFRVSPSGALTGRLRVPGDKSISHRSVMLGAIAQGTTEVSGFLDGADALSTRDVFRTMGVHIEGPGEGEESKRVRIHGVGLHGLKAPTAPLDCGNAGTAMRLLMGLLAGQAFNSTLIGDESLSKRPMKRVSDPLSKMGARISTKDGKPPVQMHASSGLTGMIYPMTVASAQVKSAILLAGLYAQGDTEVIETEITRDHTERMLKAFGVQVERSEVSLATGVVERRAKVKGGQALKACAIDVPADISSAAFFLVGASIAPGSNLTLEHVGINPTRTGILDILKLMGADIELLNKREVGGEPVADLRVRYVGLKGITVPEHLVPLAIDEFPALFVAASCAQGQTVVTGAEELRVKESDRLQVMSDGLRALGIVHSTQHDGIRIVGQPTGAGDASLAAPVFESGSVESHGDHRIAMAFAMAALRSKGPIHIADTKNVATSFPGFVALSQKAGLDIQAVA